MLMRGLAILCLLGATLVAVQQLDRYSSDPGVQERYRQEPHRETVALASSGRTVRLRADGRGHFLVEATINGRTIEMIADTGATAVALTLEDARRSGYDPRTLDFDTAVQTANGPVHVASIVLSRIEVEGIVLRDVRAVVAETDALASSLLGMSFLGRLASVKMSGDTLELVE